MNRLYDFAAGWLEYSVSLKERKFYILSAIVGAIPLTILLCLLRCSERN